MFFCAGDSNLWDVRTNTVVTTLGTDTPVTSIEITENGRYITTADGKNVTFFDAMTFTPVVYVAPLRESSVLLTVLMGSILLHEGDLKRRLGWALVIMVGVSLLATG